MPDELPAAPKASVRIDTVRLLLRAWNAHQQQRADLSGHTATHYRSYATTLAELVGDLSLARIDGPAVDRIKQRLLRSYKPRTVRQQLAILRFAWVWGSERGLVAGDFPKYRAPKIGKPRRTPTPGEVGAVLRAITDLGLCGEAAVRLIYATGARKGEASRITWRDVDESAGVVILRGKTGPRPFPLTVAIREILRDLPRTGPTIYGLRESTIQTYVHQAIDRGCKHAGVQHFSAQGLRRAAVDELARSGIDPGTAAALLGHSPTIMLQHYRQATAEDLRRAAAKLGTVPAGKVHQFRTGNGD